MATDDSHVRRLDLGSEWQAVQVPQKDFGEEAVVVWDAALVLAYYLLKHRRQLIKKDETKVLELGAGTGAVGLVAATLG